MTLILSAIEAAKMEADGRGRFTQSGCIITFRTNSGMEASWRGRSKGEATQMLRLFRASLRYPAALFAVGALNEDAVSTDPQVTGEPTHG